MRLARTVVILLALGWAGYLIWNLLPAHKRAGAKSAAAAQAQAEPDPAAQRTRIPVALNRGPEVLDGFRGDVHPLLHGQTRLKVTAGKGSWLATTGCGPGGHWPFSVTTGYNTGGSASFTASIRCHK